MAAPISMEGRKAVPTVWEERILKREFDVVLGKMLQSEQRDPLETEEPYLRSANVKWEGVDTTDIKKMWFSPREKRELILQSGDLVVNEGGDVGRCAIWDGAIKECYYQNAINRVRAKYHSSTRYLYYWLYNLKATGFVDAVVGRITIAHLTAEKLEALPWPDVPPYEQERIAAYLDASCTAIDAAVDIKRRQLETLDGLRKSTIRGAVSRGLNPSVPMRSTEVPWIPKIPDHWRLVRVKDVLDFFNTVRIPLSAAERGLMTEKTYDYYGASGVIDKVEAYLFDGAYILLAEDGANLLTRSKPLAFLATGKFWVNNHAHILKPRWGDETFFVHALESQDFSLFVTGAAQPKLTMENLGRFHLAVPPVLEQKEIVTFIQGKDIEFRRLFTQIEAQTETLTAYRKSLIHECVTGQRRISEADVRRVCQDSGLDQELLAEAGV